MITTTVYANPLDDVKKKVFDWKRGEKQEEVEKNPVQEAKALYDEIKQDMKETKEDGHKKWRQVVHCFWYTVFVLLWTAAFIWILPSWWFRFSFTASMIIFMELARVFSG
jgi:hypothetical protein